jgi:hypothetical protein
MLLPLLCSCDFIYERSISLTPLKTVKTNGFAIFDKAVFSPALFL